MPAYACHTCGKIGPSPFCEQHKPKHRSPSSRETGRGAYRRARARIQREQPPCHWCGKPATTPDHLRPVSKGGKSTPENLVPACTACNFSRGARDRPTRR